jgi:hypothetical protein
MLPRTKKAAYLAAFFNMERVNITHKYLLSYSLPSGRLFFVCGLVSAILSAIQEKCEYLSTKKKRASIGLEIRHR